MFWLLVTLGVLVTFHEFGHYRVARRCGVRVLRFSVGFGRPLWRRVAKDGTEYQIAAIPLGGYVKMLDAREGDVSPAQRATQRHAVGDRQPQPRCYTPGSTAFENMVARDHGEGRQRCTPRTRSSGRGRAQPITIDGIDRDDYELRLHGGRLSRAPNPCRRRRRPLSRSPWRMQHDARKAGSTSTRPRRTASSARPSLSFRRTSIPESGFSESEPIRADARRSGVGVRPPRGGPGPREPQPRGGHGCLGRRRRRGDCSSTGSPPTAGASRRCARPRAAPASPTGSAKISTAASGNRGDVRVQTRPEMAGSRRGARGQPADRPRRRRLRHVDSSPCRAAGRLQRPHRSPRHRGGDPGQARRDRGAGSTRTTPTRICCWSASSRARSW